MAPPPSHSQSLLPNPNVLILDRVERDADRHEHPSPAGQMNLLSVSIRSVVVVEKRRRYAAGEIPKARAK